MSEVSFKWSANTLLWGEDKWSFQNAKANPMSQWGYDQWSMLGFLKGILQIMSLKPANKKERNFICTSCSMHSNHVKNICFSNAKEMVSLQSQIKKVKSTTISQIKLQKQKLKLYDGLSKTKIIDEPHQCAVKFTSTLTKKDLMDILSYEMHGIQRLPALWYDYWNRSVEEVNLSHYKILPNESLHNVSNYIKNIYQKPPSHMTSNERKIVIEVIDQSFNSKEARNSSDYRQNVLVVCIFFIQRFSGTYYTEILKKLTEIQELLYLPEKERSATKILWFYNGTFLHTLLIRRHFQNNFKVLTPRKFFGVYYHCQMTHAREQYQIESGRSENSEREEALFTSMKIKTNQTSNHHHHTIISNIWICHQAKSKNDSFTSVERKTSYIHNIRDIWLFARSN